jgi:thiamine phosphate synthase YjbQ (UPF0047 family)
LKTKKDEEKLDPGTWQRIFFTEMDEPRNMTVNITLLGT